VEESEIKVESDISLEDKVNPLEKGLIKRFEKPVIEFNNIIVNTDFKNIAEYSAEIHSSSDPESLRDSLDYFDLSLFQISQNWEPFLKGDKEVTLNVQKIFDVTHAELLGSELTIQGYGETVMGIDKKKKIAINPNNFLVSDRGDSVVSKDLRIVTYDFTGNIPQNVLMHLSTVAFMMLHGLCDMAVGTAHIKQISKKHGVAEILYQESGYLHLKIGSEPKLELKSSVRVEKNPKK
jgi:hypothetical protein